jgi:protein-S-isoprenylcysteine O-methyltransferase Ste14
MRATEFEFRNRFWLFGLIFSLGFVCYVFDPVNTGVALLQAARVDLDSSRASIELHALFGFGALLVAAAAMIRTWATAYLDNAVVQAPGLRTERLVADGPYRHVRNPLYLANLLMTFGVALMASRTGAFVLVILMIVFQYRIIAREEDALLREQGDGYRAYCAAVPRLWPSLTPRAPSSGLRPRWRQAWFAEAFFFWGFAAGTAVFAATLDLRYYGAVFGLCMLLYFTVAAPWKRAASAKR